MKRIRINLLFILFSVSIGLSAQNKRIYVFEDRYKQPTKTLIKNVETDLYHIKILGQYMIDPKRNGLIDYNLVEKYLIKLYPDKDSSGILCINLEGKLFVDLRDHDLNSSKSKNAINQYISLLKYVKTKRPNLQVGIYGLPFTVYYKSQEIRNHNRKLDLILELSDVFFPSLYIFYPAIQKEKQANFDYFKKNLDVAFYYAEQSKKPVLPFIWYLVHPSNKRYKYEMIPKSEMKSYIHYIEEYTSIKNQKISGIVWWDTPTPYNNRSIKNNLLPKKEKRNEWTMEEAFRYYLNN